MLRLSWNILLESFYNGKILEKHKCLILSSDNDLRRKNLSGAITLTDDHVHPKLRNTVDLFTSLRHFESRYETSGIRKQSGNSQTCTVYVTKNTFCRFEMIYAVVSIEFLYCLQDFCLRSHAQSVGNLFRHYQNLMRIIPRYTVNVRNQDLKFWSQYRDGTIVVPTFATRMQNNF